MRDPQVFFNILTSNSYLLISAVGMTLVILTGGIDLSVSGVIALTTVASAASAARRCNPWVVILLMLLMGMALGAIMGGFIAYLKVQPFIATLAGMWFARGMCFFISDDAVAISHPFFRILGHTKLLIPGLSDPATQRGDFVTILIVLSFLVLIVGALVAQYTRFGRSLYAIGGDEQSARLMGLPVPTTKVLVYTLNGFCSALAGIVLAAFVASGHGLYASGYELRVIAAVVMGGTSLTGGSGYVFGTLFGVLILGLTQTLIQFNGSLSSWWTNIVIGAADVHVHFGSERPRGKAQAGPPGTVAYPWRSGFPGSTTRPGVDCRRGGRDRRPRGSGSGRRPQQGIRHRRCGYRRSRSLSCEALPPGSCGKHGPGRRGGRLRKERRTAMH